jgi:hypothetical protein
LSEWQREYRVRNRGLFPKLFVGCVLGIIGVVFSFLFFPWGLGILVLAVAVPMVIGYLGQDVTIIANQDGFSVTTESKRAGRKHEQYTWQEVTDTAYEEFTRKDKETGRQTFRYFSAQTGRGQAFRVQDNISDFADLVQVFNHSTPHIPYVWQPQTGMNVSLGPVTVGRSGYARVART